MRTKGAIAIVFLVAMSYCASVSCEEQTHFFPGRYFEHKAQFYLKKKDYRMALEMFELSGYWADKIGQYNAGMMYFSGVGIPVDKPRGAAWLRIAAEAHGDLAEGAMKVAYASLTPEQKTQADAIWKELDAKYGDGVAVARALDRYYEDTRGYTGSHLGFVGDLKIQRFDDGHAGEIEHGATFARENEQQREELLDKIAGRVSVGSVQPLNVPANAKAGVAATPIDVPAKPAEKN